MNVITRTSGALPLIALAAMTMSAPLLAQSVAYEGEPGTTVTAMPPADLSELETGPEINGIITARGDNRFKVTAEDGTDTVLYISDASEIRSSGGFLGLARDKLGADALLNGLYPGYADPATLVKLGDAWLDEHIAADNALKRLIVENVASSHRTLKVREYNEAL